MVQRLRTVLQLYEDVFQDTFPTIEYNGCTDEELIDIIRECINTGEPVSSNYDNIQI